MTQTTTHVRLEDLFPVYETGCSAYDGETLTAMIRDGYVRVQRHPTLPLRIFNYSEKAAYEGVWNAVTLTCRGLIVDDEDRIAARPFAKFFNYGQAGAAEIPLDAKVQVVDKMDGSLGIVYPVPGGYAIATRGSFASEQALHATQVLQARYPQWWPTPGWTALFEIVYPSNRIVVDYGDVDDLVALGVVDIETGEVHQPGALRLMGWKGPVAKVFEAETLAEALAMSHGRTPRASWPARSRPAP
jgi:RNA ligase